MSRRHRNADAIEKRRAEIGLMWEAHMTQQSIANRLGVSVGTVNRDIQILRARWRKTQEDATNTVMVDDLHRIEVAIGAIWPQVLTGDYNAIDRLLALIRERAKLLGYEPPKRVDVTSDGRPIRSITAAVAHVALPESE